MIHRIIIKILGIFSILAEKTKPKTNLLDTPDYILFKELLAYDKTREVRAKLSDDRVIIVKPEYEADDKEITWM